MPVAQQTAAHLAAVDFDIDSVRVRLLDERADRLRTLEDATETAKTGRSDVTDGIGETEHLVRAEQADVSTRVGALAKAALEEVDAALARVDDGTYGLCSECGGPIPVERLEALPAAGTCVACTTPRQPLFR